MSLPAGARLGAYEIGAKLGAGGMGEVYEARDARLGRTVALKVLPQDLLTQEGARVRFLREAKLAASLNHPNVVTIFEADVGRIDEAERLYIAMERVQGETLARRIQRDRPGLAVAIDWAVQIADALSHAHAAGVVHRDLKPSNVMITSDGRIKILDFGLAKYVQPPSSDVLDQTRTTESPTSMHTVLGTPAYMSPEQAEGRPSDARSDLFSCGVLLYELFTGRAAFQGASVVSILGAVLRDTPPAPSAVHPGLPADLDWILAKAMEKQAGDRYQHADELAVDLRALKRQVTGTTPVRPTARATTHRVRGRGRVLTVAAILVAVAASVWGWQTFLRPAPQVMRFISQLPDGLKFDDAGFFGSSLAIAPDGSQIVAAAFDGALKKTRLLRQRVGDFAIAAIDGTDGARAPFISHDGQWVGFVDGRDVKRVPIMGATAPDAAGLAGQSRSLLQVDVAFFGGDFDRDGDTILIGECTRGLRAWSLSRKVKDRISDVASDSSGVFQHQFPQMLPDDEHLLLTAWLGPEAELHVRHRGTGQEKKIVENAAYGRYVESGHLVWAWEGSLYAAPFDLDRLEITEAPQQVLEGVATEGSRGAAHFAVSTNGTLVYLPGAHVPSVDRLSLVSRDGTFEDIGRGRSGQGAKFSKDGRELATAFSAGARSEVWIYELARKLWRPGPRILQPHEVAGAWWPAWTPDGREIWFQKVVAGGQGVLMREPIDGAGAQAEVARAAAYIQPQSWISGGQSLVYTIGGDETKSYDIWTLDIASGRRAPLVASPDGEIHPAVSPDGRWLAYATDQSGALRVVVRRVDGTGRVIQVSEDQHIEPRWSGDGRTLYYRRTDGRRIMAVPFDGASGTPVGAASVAFEGDFTPGVVYGINWDLSPDGSRALVWQRPAPVTMSNQYVVILNWLEELKRRF